MTDRSDGDHGEGIDLSRPETATGPVPSPKRDTCPRCWGTGLALPVCIRNCAFTIIPECCRCGGTGRRQPKGTAHG